METTERRNSPIERQVAAYREDWKDQHDQAMHCRVWEEVLAIGVQTGQTLSRLEAAWREQVFRGAIDWNETADQRHRDHLALWCQVSRCVLDDIVPELEADFVVVEWAEELRRDLDRAERHLAEWQRPRATRAIGLREMTLSPDSARELDRRLEAARATPPSMPTRPMETRGPEFLLQ